MNHTFDGQSWGREKEECERERERVRARMRHVALFSSPARPFRSVYIHTRADTLAIGEQSPSAKNAACDPEKIRKPQSNYTPMLALNRASIAGVLSYFFWERGKVLEIHAYVSFFVEVFSKLV